MSRLSMLALLTLGCASEPAPTDPPLTEGSSLTDGSSPDHGPTSSDLEPASQDHVPGRLLVGLEQGVPAPTGLPGRLSRRLLDDRVGVLELDDGVDLAQAREELARSGRFRFVEPDWIGTIYATNDPLWSAQWSMSLLEVDAAWQHADGMGATVAVIDTGVRRGGPDGIVAILPGYDFVHGDTDPSDDHGHGTHVAGTIAQASDNAVGAAGVAPGTTILPLKACTAWGTCAASAVAAAVDYARLSGVEVINLSLGYWVNPAVLETAIDAAVADGIFVAAAAGNDWGSAVRWPAALPDVVAVGATTQSDARAAFSNIGPEVDLSAPGQGIVQETIQRGTWIYPSMNGTSMATPHVAAAAALLMSVGATAEQAEDQLAATAVDLGTPGRDDDFGHGRIDPIVALTEWVCSAACGDVNSDGAINVLDVVKVNSYTTAPPDDWSCEALSADTDEDGDIDASDVQAVLDAALGVRTLTCR